MTAAPPPATTRPTPAVAIGMRCVGIAHAQTRQRSAEVLRSLFQENAAAYTGGDAHHAHGGGAVSRLWYGPFPEERAALRRGAFSSSMPRFAVVSDFGSGAPSPGDRWSITIQASMVPQLLACAVDEQTAAQSSTYSRDGGNATPSPRRPSGGRSSGRALRVWPARERVFTARSRAPESGGCGRAMAPVGARPGTAAALSSS